MATAMRERDVTHRYSELMDALERASALASESSAYAERAVRMVVQALARILPDVERALGTRVTRVSVTIYERDGTVKLGFHDASGRYLDSIDMREHDEELAEALEKMEELLSTLRVWEDDFQDFPVPVEVNEV